MRSALRLLVPLVVLVLSSVPGAFAQQEPAPAPAEPPAVPAESSAAPAESPAVPAEPAAEDPGAKAFKLAKEGRSLLKAGQVAQGVARMQEAVAQGEKAGLAADELADLLDAYGTALRRARRNEDARDQFRRASTLSPKDAEIRLDLAGVLLRLDDADGALVAAREALALGLPADEVGDARDLLKEAREQRLHDRLQVAAGVSFGYDSNVLQGTAIQTIAGKTTGAAGRSQIRRVTGLTTKAQQITALDKLYDTAVINTYRTAIPSPAEWDLPITVNLDVQGRLAGQKRVELWAGYRFSQTIMTRYSNDPNGVDHDPFNFQEHDVYLRLNATPRPWFLLKLRAEGFANFSGLRDFTPFQWGINGLLDATFIESPRWRTLFSFKHNFRYSFNQGTDQATGGDAYLNGNRDDLGLLQELRLRWFRARAGYRFHSDITGTLESEVPFAVSVIDPVPLSSPTPASICPQTYTSPPSPPANNPNAMVSTDLGCFLYFSPLGYQGHELALYLRFLLPYGIEIGGSGHYEYRSYGAAVPGNGSLYGGYYQAEYKAIRTQITLPGTTTRAYVPPLGVLGDPLINNIHTQLDRLRVARIDDLISADATITKDLPHGFSLALSYALMYNISNVANGLDNRNYTKHTVLILADYDF